MLLFAVSCADGIACGLPIALPCLGGPGGRNALLQYVYFDAMRAALLQPLPGEPHFWDARVRRDFESTALRLRETLYRMGTIGNTVHTRPVIHPGTTAAFPSGRVSLSARTPGQFRVQ